MTAVHSSSTLSDNRTLAQNTALNLIGQGAPLLAALFAIPLLVKGMGIDRFGILALVWMMIGYSSLFDFGLGRAMTKLVAERLGHGREGEISSLVWTGLCLMALFGLVGMVCLVFLSPWLITDILKIPEALKIETLRAFYLVALSVPVVIITTALRGILEAHQQFSLIVRVSIPLGVFTFLGPLLALVVSNDLFTIVAVLMIARLAAGVAYLTLCFRTEPDLRRHIRPQRSMIRPLIGFGSWMTVTNIVGPIMDYLDRLLIGALLSVAAVAYYATPYDVVTRLWLVPVALTGVLFPAFASSLEFDRDRAAHLFRRSVKYVFLALFPVVLVIVTLAHEGLELWLGDEFAANSHHVLQWLAVGVLVNSLARLPYALLQAAGRPDLTAKLHLIELPLYLLAVWMLINNYGIEGAAMAWTARVALDAVFLFALAGRFAPRPREDLRKALLTIFTTSLVLACAVFISMNLAAKAGFILAVLFLFALAARHLVLGPDERAAIGQFLRKGRPDNGSTLR